MSSRTILRFTVVILFVLLLLPLTTEAASVRPLVINLDTVPGEKKTFEFVVASQGIQEMVGIKIYQTVQESDGNLAYNEGIYDSVTDWITLERDTLVIPPDQEVKVTGYVNVPFSAGGTYVAAIMVEPSSSGISQGITVRYRYAIRLVVNVERPGLRPDLAVHSLDLEPNEQMVPVAKAVIRNTSPLMFPVAAEMTVRDKSRAIIERVELLSDASKTSEYRSISILPGVDLWLDAPITRPLFPGDYELRLFLRYADGKQKVHTQMVTVAEGDFVYDENTKYLAVNPDLLQAHLRLGGADSQILELTNNSNEPLFVEIGGRDIEPQYERSIFKNLQLELRGENILKIAPRRAARVVITMRAPREGVAGGYYGLISATAFSQDLELLNTYDVPVYAIVGQDPHYGAEVLSLLVTTLDEERLISVTVKNDSDVHIVPTGICYLKNVEGEILYSIPLSLPEGVQDILPYYTGLLVADGLTIPAGEYVAEVRVLVNEQQLAIREENISIQDQD